MGMRGSCYIQNTLVIDNNSCGCSTQFRSLFVPYFKYLLDGCVRHLTNSGDAKYTGSIPKRKKAKVHVSGDSKEETVSLKSWHIRALVLSSLHKCFLYDTGSLKFLDSSNFQVNGSCLSLVTNITDLYQPTFDVTVVMLLSMLSSLVSGCY